MYLLIQLTTMIVAALVTHYFWGAKLGYTRNNFRYLLIGLVLGTLITRVTMLALPRIGLTLLALAVPVVVVGGLWLAQSQLEGKSRTEIADRTLRFVNQQRTKWAARNKQDSYRA